MALAAERARDVLCPKDAGRYTDAEALDIAERMNGGGDRPVRLVPLANLERFLERAAFSR